ncbi:MAG TPA: hypothetical protein VHA74_02690 [Candidatus Dojkabacteria bacterium]|nr:hypothetical protein [Candidatus Dojkabacteria bacterium]
MFIAKKIKSRNNLFWLAYFLFFSYSCYEKVGRGEPLKKVHSGNLPHPTSNGIYTDFGNGIVLKTQKYLVDSNHLFSFNKLDTLMPDIYPLDIVNDSAFRCGGWKYEFSSNDKGGELNIDGDDTTMLHVLDEPFLPNTLLIEAPYLVIYKTDSLVYCKIDELTGNCTNCPCAYFISELRGKTFFSRFAESNNCYVSPLSIGDFDNDSRLDIAIIETSSSISKVVMYNFDNKESQKYYVNLLGRFGFLYYQKYNWPHFVN